MAGKAPDGDHGYRPSTTQVECCNDVGVVRVRSQAGYRRKTGPVSAVSRQNTLISERVAPTLKNSPFKTQKPALSCHGQHHTRRVRSCIFLLGGNTETERTANTLFRPSNNVGVAAAAEPHR